MPRPKGSKNKPKGVENAKGKEEEKEALLSEEGEVEKTEPRKDGLEPLAPGQRYFESPEGHILIGEDSKDKIWCRQTNGWKGGFINPKR